jgi:hypothetical protein
MVNGQECEKKRLSTVLRQYRNIHLNPTIYSVNIVPSGGYLSLPTPPQTFLLTELQQSVCNHTNVTDS